MIKTAEALKDELFRAVLDARVLIARLDRIQHAEVMEEDISEVEFRDNINTLSALIGEMVDHDLIGGIVSVVAAMEEAEGREMGNGTRGGQ